MDDIKTSAQDLAELFLRFADTVRAYWREHYDELSQEQLNDLKSRVVQFEDMHDRFAADAIAETLVQVASQMKDLQAATVKANAAVKTVNRIEDVTRILAGVLGAAECAAAGDLGGTADRIADLVGSLLPSGDTATAKG